MKRKKKLAAAAVASAIVGLSGVANALVINYGNGRCGLYDIDDEGYLVLLFTFGCAAATAPMDP